MASMESLCTTCQQAAQLVGGKAECDGSSCAISIPRKNLKATIQGRETHAEEVLSIALMIERPDAAGRSLCLGEAVLLESEVNGFVRDLQRVGIRLTAVHNHWFEDRPRLIYVHFQAIMNPIRFAQGLAPTLKRLSG